MSAKAVRKKRIPKYSTVEVKGYRYYRTFFEDTDGNQVALYGKTREELYEKELKTLERFRNVTCDRKAPTVKEYCEK